MDSLSRLTKVQELRKKIADMFHVEPQLQRLFYRGKQVKWPPQLSIHPPSFVPGTLPLKATKQECSPLVGCFRCCGKGEQRLVSAARLATFLVVL